MGSLFTGIPPFLVHNIPCWSLLCFFLCEIVYWPINKWIGKDWIIVILSITLTFFISKVLGHKMGELPLTLGPTLSAIGFYAIGHMCRRFIPMSDESVSKNLSPLVLLGGVFLCFGANLLCNKYNGEVLFFICDYGLYPLYLLSSLFGAIGVIGVSMLLALLLGRNTFITTISIGTLLICGFHLLAFAVIKGCGLLLGFSPYELTAGLWRGIAFSILVLCLLYPFIVIIRKYAKWLVDK